MKLSNRFTRNFVMRRGFLARFCQKSNPIAIIFGLSCLFVLNISTQAANRTHVNQQLPPLSHIPALGGLSNNKQLLSTKSRISSAQSKGR